MVDAVKRLIKPQIQALSAYHVPNSDGLIKLDAMENPYSWPEQAEAQWRSVFADPEVNRYPDPSATEVRQALREAMSIADDLDIVLGNGSDEIIQMILMAVNGAAGVLVPTPTFVMYEMMAQFFSIPFYGVPLTEDFELDLPAMLAAVKKHQPDVIFLAYPNNPTGNAFVEADVNAIIKAADGLVVIDEAYAPFTDVSYLETLSQWDNVVVMRTVSKMGLAGLRLGYLVGHPDWIEQFDKVRLPYNINVLTQKAAVIALSHQSDFDEQAMKIRESRQQLMEALSELPINIFPSETNFLLIRMADHEQALSVFDGLKQEGILIKILSRPDTPLVGCLRVTVGSEPENTAFLAAFKRHF